MLTLKGIGPKHICSLSWLYMIVLQRYFFVFLLQKILWVKSRKRRPQVVEADNYQSKNKDQLVFQIGRFKKLFQIVLI